MEVFIYLSDYTGRVRFALRQRDPGSSTGWRYVEDAPRNGEPDSEGFVYVRRKDTGSISLIPLASFDASRHEFE